MTIDQLMKLEPWLKSEIVGQDESVERVTKAVHRAELGIQRGGQPRFVFLFLGPTGVGKTETTLRLARFLYGENYESRLARFDMAEYQDPETAVKQLIGASKGEQGLMGDSIDRLNSQGGGIMLFDEIEKAYKEVVTLFLAATDAARITMSTGETKSLEKMYLVFTSNLGSAKAIAMENSSTEAVRSVILRATQKHFSPELLARFSARGGLCIFDRLDYDDQLKICRNNLEKELKVLSNQKDVTITTDGSEVFNYLVDIGYDKRLGARPMRGAIEREVGDAWVRFLASEYRDQQQLVLTKEKGIASLFLLPAARTQTTNSLCLNP